MAKEQVEDEEYGVKLKDQAEDGQLKPEFVEPSFKQRLTNIILLAFVYCFTFAAYFIQFSTTILAVQDIANSYAAATIPIGIMTFTAFCVATPSLVLMQRFGRRLIFSVNSVLGLVGGVLLAVGAQQRQAFYFYVGAVFLGFLLAVANNFRFVATEFATPDFKPKALAITVGGASLAAVIGPEVSRLAAGAFDKRYVGSYLVLCVLIVVQLFCVNLVSYKMLDQLNAQKVREMKELQGQEVVKRPVLKIVSQRQYLLSAIVAGAIFAAMTGPMTTVPLSMKESFQDTLNDDQIQTRTTRAVQLHLLSMFLPSFFSGNLVSSFGAANVMLLGSAILFAGIATPFGGLVLYVYLIAMAVLGIGWNFAYVSASALAITTFTPPEKFVAQGVFDSIVLFLQSIATCTSGLIMAATSFETVLTIYMVVSGICMILSVVEIVMSGSLTKMLKSRSCPQHNSVNGQV